MVLTSSEIKKYLQNTFQIGFDVIHKGEWFLVTPSESYKSLFILKIKFKDDLRFVAECEPDEYGVPFLETVRDAKLEKKEAFIILKNKLVANSTLSKIKILINNEVYSDEQFLKTNTWSKLHIRFTKIPYFESEENKKDQALFCIKNFTLLILSLLDCVNTNTNEGEESLVMHKHYERDQTNRTICLNVKGYKCQICGCNLEDLYGDIAKNFIEVHHIKPISELNTNYSFDPINDLIPVCPNCHAMLHRKNPPFQPSELVEIVNKNSKKNN